MIRSVFTVVAFTCSMAFTSSAQAQTVASLGREPASFFERLFGGPISPTARRLVSWPGTQRPGTIVISTSQRRLYFVLGSGQAIQYGVGVGRPGFTWTGTKTVSMKREWPAWSPPAAMLRRIHEVLRPGGFVMVGVPVIDSVVARLLGSRWGAVTEAPRHLSLPSFGGLIGMLRRAGFGEVATAPAPLAERGGDLVLSILPTAATTMSYGRGATVAALARRCAAALLMVPAMLVALAEQASWTGPGRTETMLFSGRKAPQGACRVS